MPRKLEARFVGCKKHSKENSKKLNNEIFVDTTNLYRKAYIRKTVSTPINEQDKVAIMVRKLSILFLALRGERRS